MLHLFLNKNQFLQKANKLQAGVKVKQDILFVILLVYLGRK